MDIINTYLIITIRIRVLLEKRISATLILEVDKYSKTLKCQKLDRYIKTKRVDYGLICYLV